MTFDKEKEIVCKVDEANDRLDCLHRSMIGLARDVPPIILKVLIQIENELLKMYDGLTKLNMK